MVPCPPPPPTSSSSSSSTAAVRPSSSSLLLFAPLDSHAVVLFKRRETELRVAMRMAEQRQWEGMTAAWGHAFSNTALQEGITALTFLEQQQRKLAMQDEYYYRKFVLTAAHEELELALGLREPTTPTSLSLSTSHLQPTHPSNSTLGGTERASSRSAFPKSESPSPRHHHHHHHHQHRAASPLLADGEEPLQPAQQKVVSLERDYWVLQIVSLMTYALGHEERDIRMRMRKEEAHAWKCLIADAATGLDMAQQQYQRRRQRERVEGYRQQRAARWAEDLLRQHLQQRASLAQDELLLRCSLIGTLTVLPAHLELLKRARAATHVATCHAQQRKLCSRTDWHRADAEAEESDAWRELMEAAWAEEWFGALESEWYQGIVLPALHWLGDVAPALSLQCDARLCAVLKVQRAWRSIRQGLRGWRATHRTLRGEVMLLRRQKSRAQDKAVHLKALEEEMAQLQTQD